MLTTVWPAQMATSRLKLNLGSRWCHSQRPFRRSRVNTARSSMTAIQRCREPGYKQGYRRRSAN